MGNTCFNFRHNHGNPTFDWKRRFIEASDRYPLSFLFVGYLLFLLVLVLLY